MTEAFLTRARLRADAPGAALRPLLVSGNGSERVSAGHRLVWTLFGDTADRTRDFLWREAEPGLFFVLSSRLPEDHSGLFELDEPKPFAPSLNAGDRLGFTLRANATVSRGGKGKRRGTVSDVVMDALHSVPPGERAAARGKAVAQAGSRWLASQAGKAGFSVGAEPNPQKIDGFEHSPARGDETAAVDGNSVVVSAYRTIRLDRRRGDSASLGVLDFDGVLKVRDPVLFVASVLKGFGRAKAFGCGLMLIRRV